MAKTRTKEDLIDKIGQDHVWRLREISELKSLIKDTYFLEYVAGQRHSVSELRSNFITLLVRGKIDKASESNKYSAFDEVTRYIINNQSTRAKIPTKNVVETQSNLSTNVLKEILWCLGLSYDYFEPKEKLIDLKLVGRRNHVAHGESIDIENDDFVDMADEVIGLMLAFKNLLENSCMTESYRAA